MYQINFSPLDLLSKDQLSLLSANQKQELGKKMQYKFEEFLTIKLSDELNEHQLEEVLDCINFAKRLVVFNKYISDLDQKIAKNTEEYEKQFKEQIQ